MDKIESLSLEELLFELHGARKAAAGDTTLIKPPPGSLSQIPGTDNFAEKDQDRYVAEIPEERDGHVSVSLYTDPLPLKKAGRQRLTQIEKVARAPTGLYGFTKKIQGACERSSGKLMRKARKLARTLWRKDEKVVDFLSIHARRTGSVSAKVLLAALGEIGPNVKTEELTYTNKEAAKKGLYGFREKTATLGLGACSTIRHEAGKITYDMHMRKPNSYEHITGFLKKHARSDKCAASRLLLFSYPDSSTFKAASENETAREAKESLSSVEDWIQFEG